MYLHIIKKQKSIFPGTSKFPAGILISTSAKKSLAKSEGYPAFWPQGFPSKLFLLF